MGDPTTKYFAALERRKKRLAADAMDGAPFWEKRIDLPSWLEDIAAQIRRGDISICCEAVVLTRDMAHEDAITILRWGENTLLTSQETLREIAENSRTIT